MYLVVMLLCHQFSVSQLAQQIKHAIIVPEFRWYLSDNDAEEKNSEARIRDAVFSDDKSESTKSTKSTV